MIKNRLSRRYALYSFIVLIIAVLSKFYRGPGWIGVNAWAGDIGIVICLYFLLGAILPGLKPLIKLLIITLIAVSVECFQMTNIPASWDLPIPFVWVLGSQFDARDFVFYAIGLGIAFIVDLRYYDRS